MWTVFFRWLYFDVPVRYLLGVVELLQSELARRSLEYTYEYRPSCTNESIDIVTFRLPSLVSP